MATVVACFRSRCPVPAGRSPTTSPSPTARGAPRGGGLFGGGREDAQGVAVGGAPRAPPPALEKAVKALRADLRALAEANHAHVAALAEDRVRREALAPTPLLELRARRRARSTLQRWWRKREAAAKEAGIKAEEAKKAAAAAKARHHAAARPKRVSKLYDIFQDFKPDIETFIKTYSNDSFLFNSLIDTLNAGETLNSSTIEKCVSELNEKTKQTISKYLCEQPMIRDPSQVPRLDSFLKKLQTRWRSRMSRKSADKAGVDRILQHINEINRLIGENKKLKEDLEGKLTYLSRSETGGMSGLRTGGGRSLPKLKQKGGAAEKETMDNRTTLNEEKKII